MKVLSETIFKFSYMFFFKSLPLILLTICHIYEISEINHSDAPAIIDGLFTPLARVFPGYNNRAELVTLASGLRILLLRILLSVAYSTVNPLAFLTADLSVIFCIDLQSLSV